MGYVWVVVKLAHSLCRYGPILEALYAALEDRQCQEALHAQATARSGGRSIAQQIALVRQAHSRSGQRAT